MTTSKKNSERLPRILLCATGCAQGEVLPRLVSNLCSHPNVGQHEVIVAATKPALQFFEKSEVEKITGHNVYTDLFCGDEHFPDPAFDLSAWADLIIVYPASANMVSKCAAGICDSIVSSIVLQSEDSVFFGVCTNDRLHNNPILQKNIEILESAGHQMLPKMMHEVFIHSTGDTVEKMYCSETIVLAAVELILHPETLDPSDEEISQAKPQAAERST